MQIASSLEEEGIFIRRLALRGAIHRLLDAEGQLPSQHRQQARRDIEKVRESGYRRVRR